MLDRNRLNNGLVVEVLLLIWLAEKVLRDFTSLRSPRRTVSANR